MKLIRLLLIAFVLFVSTIRQADACTCGVWPLDFFEALREYLSINPADSLYKMHVVKATKTGVVQGYGARFKITRYYSGMLFNDTVTVWGYNGYDCRQAVQTSNFPIGDTFFLIMMKVYGSPYGPEDEKDFEVSGCGIHYIAVKGDSVFGDLPNTFAFKGYPLDLFEDSLCRMLGKRCLPAGFKTPDRVLRNLIIYPNPAAGYVTISGSKGYLEIADATGRVVYHKYLEGNDVIDTSLWPPGMFFAVLRKEDGSMATGKLVKD